MTTSKINEYYKQKQLIKNFIIEALRQLIKPSQTKEILIKVNELMVLDAKNQYAEKGYIMGNFEKDKANFKETDFQKMIDKRTIQRRLSELVEEGLLGRKDYYFYSLADKVKHNVKYHAPQFGGFALADIMSVHWPMLFNVEGNVKKLVEMFGVYLMYCLIEGARPAVIEVREDEKKSIDMISEEQANLTKYWVENVFNPMDFYSYFLSTFQYQPTDKEASTNLKKFGVDNSKHGPSIQDLDIERFKVITGQYTGDRREPKELDEIQFELSAKRVKDISNVIKQEYPDLYSMLSEARASFLGVPKQLSQYQKDMVTLGSFGTDGDTGEEETTVIHHTTKKKSLSKPRKLVNQSQK
jgi:hypothetical protein